MGKLLFWLAVIFVGLLVARLLAQRAGKSSRQPSSPCTHSGQTSEALVRCTHCGIHLPRSQAVLVGGQIWCSQAHAHEHQQARRTQSG